MPEYLNPSFRGTRHYDRSFWFYKVSPYRLSVDWIFVSFDVHFLNWIMTWSKLKSAFLRAEKEVEIGKRRKIVIFTKVCCCFVACLSLSKIFFYSRSRCLSLSIYLRSFLPNLLLYLNSSFFTWTLKLNFKWDNRVTANDWLSLEICPRQICRSLVTASYILRFISPW